MASIKVDLKDGEKYVRIVESFRDETGVSRIRTLASLGKVTEKSLASLKKMGDKLYALAGMSMEDVENEKVKELGRFNYGYFMICRKLMAHFNLDKLLRRVGQQHKLKFSLADACLLMVMERMNDPSSKRSNFFHQQEYLGLPRLELHQLYRGLDYLAEAKEKIQDQIFYTGRDLFSTQLDVVFYDVTTFYFESQEEIPETLRQKGFGKDGKIGNTQVVFSLLIDKDKQPIAYEVYAGNTFEGHTFKHALAKLKSRYQINKIIVVADRGMLSRENLSELVDHQGFEYILGERLRMLPRTVQESFLDLKQYQKEWVMNEEKNLIIRYCTIEYEGRMIIGTWSASRAEKDRKDREERLEKAAKLLSRPGALNAKASRYFIKNNVTGDYKLNESKIERDKKFDGFLAIATNARHLPIGEILDQYKHLYQVEHAFRTFKGHLETRPMFHWTDKRIQGHLCLCYISYAMQTFIQNQLKTRQTPLSENEIRKSLDRMQMSLVKQGTEEFFIKSSLTKQGEDIQKCLEINDLPEFMRKAQIINML